MAKRGRRGKYKDWLTEDNLLRIEGWARDGLSSEQIAHNMGISVTTLRDWMAKYDLISTAIKKGKAPVDLEVENAMYKSAIGYKEIVRVPIKVKTKKQLKDKGTIEEEHIEYVDEERYIEPKVAAQIFWLKNRRPSKWKDKPTAETEKDDALLNMLRKWDDATGEQ